MTRTTRLWLLVAPAALVLGAAASALTVASDHLEVRELQALLAALTGWSFIAAGLIARTRRPLNRTGVLLIAVGFTWFLGSGLSAADDSLLWTLGVAVTALPAGFLIHLLLAYPNGQLDSRWDRILVVTGYVLVAIAEAVHLPFEPDPLACADCPENAFLISDQELVADVIAFSVRLIAVAYLLAVVATIVRRWRSSSPAARRALTPVLLAGGATLFLFAIAVGAQSFSRTVSDVAGWTAMVVLIEVPFLFLWGLLQSRLARAEISRALAEGLPGGAQDRVRQLLHDPSAELLYACQEPFDGYIDEDGRPRQAVADAGRAVTLIERDGRRLGAIVHDAALLDEPALLEQVAAAVGLEIERDKSLGALQASEQRSRALLNALPDKMFRLSGDGIVLDIQDNPPLPPSRVQVGSSVYDAPVPREVTDRVMAAGRLALATGELQTFEWEVDFDGDRRHAEGRFIPSGENEFFVVIRDVTERKRQEAERAALHRVALAIASEARAEQIFDLVAEEIGRVLGAHTTNLVRYESGGLEGVVVGGWREAGALAIPVGARRPTKGTASEAVFRTAHPVRFELEHGNVPPELGEEMRALGVDSLIAAPIILAGRIWGAVVATLMAPHTFPPGAEERLAAFTRLVSLALANEEAREELASSRARLVTAGDEERRRLERNLHDGAQQRLVSVSLALRLAQAKLSSTQDAADELLSHANAELTLALEELRELARGIHPAVLTERGLGPAVAALAERAPLPVELDLSADGRLPKQVEAAAYYVVSEALANVAKYAAASRVTVRLAEEDGQAVIEVVDDGVGGADPEQGSGLRGLVDRVEALNGHLVVASAVGKGTTVRAEIPLGNTQARKEGAATRRPLAGSQGGLTRI